MADLKEYLLGDAICMGDNICLFSDEVEGFLFGNQSSSAFSAVAIKNRQDKESPKVADPQMITFEIQIAYRFKANKKYRLKMEEAESNRENASLNIAAYRAKGAAEAEDMDNELEQQRQRGKQLLYGQVIQLRHVFTQKNLCVSTTQTSVTESNNMLVKLIEYNAKHCQFKVLPRFKVKAEGDVVHTGDQIVLESVKTPGQYLHVSRVPYGPSSQYNEDCFECNLSVRNSGFSLERRSAPYESATGILTAGRLVRFFHRELEAYVTAEGLFEDQVTEDVHLRIRYVDANKPATLLPSSSAITYWQIEKEEGVLDGGTIRWTQQVRFKHVTTRKYLLVNAKNKFELTDNHRDPLTVFRLHPIMEEGDEVKVHSYCRIEHVVSKFWLSGSSKEDYSRKQKEGSGNSFESLKYTNAPLKVLSISEEMKYDDAFTIQDVDTQLVAIYNYMAGMVPFIQKLVADMNKGIQLSAKYSLQVTSAMKEMTQYMVVDGEPVKNRQKLMRNLRIIELLINVLKFPMQSSSHQVPVFVEIFELISIYLLGDSRKNELYIAKHIPFFLTLITHPDRTVALHAAHMVTEVLRDNRKIVDRISRQQITQIIDLLRQQKNYRYLDLLSVLCLCDNVAMAENQNFITEAWLVQGKEDLVYINQLGDQIGLQAGVPYVSKDGRKTWILLSTFAEKMLAWKQDTEVDEYLFLERQLDLMANLSYGRNERAIDVITNKQMLLSWEEAFTCLRDATIPDDLRAKYCNLIIQLYVDVPGNLSWLDRVNLSYSWESIGSANAADKHKMDFSPVTTQHFPALREWIEMFFGQNEWMTASMVGRNMLIEKVLNLVYLLVEFGFYNTNDVRSLMKPLIDMVDSDDDRPYPDTNVDPQEYKIAWESYSKSGRFQPSEETKVIVEAKYQAMRVLDLFFNILLNTRLEEFLQEFKTTSTQARLQAATDLELAPLLYETFDIETEETVVRRSVWRLKAMFERTAIFDDSFVSAILDLSNYQYDKMVQKSMSLINRYYTCYEQLFHKALRSQILVTTESCKVLKQVQVHMPVLKQREDTSDDNSVRNHSVSRGHRSNKVADERRAKEEKYKKKKGDRSHRSSCC